ncbi:DSS1/SEM1 family [Nakaseomyces glabratus]
MDEKNVEERRTLEEDDEFEDFPVDTWGDKDTVASTSATNATSATNGIGGTSGTNGKRNIIWEENWDDVEADDDFTQELRAELQK